MYLNRYYTVDPYSRWYPWQFAHATWTVLDASFPGVLWGQNSCLSNYILTCYWHHSWTTWCWTKIKHQNITYHRIDCIIRCEALACPRAIIWGRFLKIHPYSTSDVYIWILNMLIRFQGLFQDILDPFRVLCLDKICQCTLFTYAGIG